MAARSGITKVVKKMKMFSSYALSTRLSVHAIFYLTICLISSAPWTNYPYSSVRLFDNTDNSVFFVNRSKYSVRRVQPDESLLLGANSSKSVLLRTRTRQALFDYNCALCPASSAGVAAQIQQSVSCRPRHHAGPGKGAN